MTFPRAHIADVATFGTAMAVAAGMFAVENFSPELAHHPAAPAASSGVVIAVMIAMKLIERRWFSTNDNKTDTVAKEIRDLRGAIDESRDSETKRIDRIGERVDRLVERVETLAEREAKHAGVNEELGRLSGLLGRMLQRIEKAERDLDALHNLRRQKA